MAAWAVTMVKNEIDILPYTLAHLDMEGIDGLVVADNLSEDGTWEWLQSYRPRCQLDLVRDTDPAYYQGEKMTGLAHRAFRHGAQWVIAFDADELWFNASSRTTLAATLADHEPADVLHARLHNYFPTSADSNDPNPFRRVTHRDPLAAPLPKVIVANRPGIAINVGNHSATGPDLRSASTPIEVAHFPWRSAEQFTRKTIQGARALAATDLPDDIGTHWRRHGELWDQAGDQALHDVFHEWYHDPEMSLEHAPAPWGRFHASESS